VVRCVDRPFPYEIFNLGESHTTSLAELIELIAKHVGKPAVIDRKPLQPGDVEITYADVSHARELLGYAPRFSMDEGIRRFVAWYRSEYGL
jgi:UDP-glucuronate 4-epimerase